MDVDERATTWSDPAGDPALSGAALKVGLTGPFRRRPNGSGLDPVRPSPSTRAWSARLATPDRLRRLCPVVAPRPAHGLPRVRCRPFQVLSITFAIGGWSDCRAGSCGPAPCGLSRQPARVWALGNLRPVRLPRALYFAALKLAPPAEAGLVNYLWPLLIVLFSAGAPRPAAEPRPRRGRASRLRGRRRARVRARLAPGAARGPCRIRLRLRGGVHLGGVFRAVAPRRRGCRRMPSRAFVSRPRSSASSVTSRGKRPCGQVARRMDRSRRERARPGGGGVLPVGRRHEARRRAAARGGLLRHPGRLDAGADRGRLRGAVACRSRSPAA